MLRGAPFRCSKSLHPGPHYGGRVPARRSRISGAQNLSGNLNSHRATGPWVCRNQGPVRFHNCAWVFSANAPGANPGGPVWDRPLRRRETVFVIRRRGGSQTRPLKPSPSKGEGVWPEARRMRALSWRAHPPAGGPRASPTQTRKIRGKPVRRGLKVNCPARARSRPQAHFEANRRKAAALRPR